MKNQPANSPDLNVCDLGLFHLLDLMQLKIPKTTLDGLIVAIISSFQDMDMNVINRCFMTLQRCISEIIMVEGGNNYRVPHMHKSCCLRANELPENAALTYLVRMRLHQGQAAYDPVHLFGSDDSDLSASDDESVVELEEATRNVARMPVIMPDEDDDNDTVEAHVIVASAPSNAKRG